MNNQPNANFIFTSESVTEGHPDKVADYIADAILDAYLERDPHSRVACEVLVKSDTVVIAGEITSAARNGIDLDAVVRAAIREIGFTDPAQPFSASRVKVIELLTEQSPEIAQGIVRGGEARTTTSTQGAGDQGIMFGYATDETPELMPLPIMLAHRLSRALANARRGGVSWLRPDGKTQVSVEYQGGRPVRVTDLIFSTQHDPEMELAAVERFVRSDLIPRVLGEWDQDDLRILVNPAGPWTIGGPAADTGLTGRKIIVDTYGGMARHGGGAFSGKDPSKVDRSGAYFCRWVARQIVLHGLARRAEVQVSYAIGRPEPVSILVETFGTGDPRQAAEFARQFDFRPGSAIERLSLLRPIYHATTHYGHFGRGGLPWEE